MMRKIMKLSGIAGLAMAFMGVRLATADIIVSNGPIQNDVTGEFQYTVELATGAYLEDGDGLVIYDFPNLITSGPMAPTLTGLPGFTFTLVQSLTGNDLDAPTTSVNDNPPGNDVDTSVAGLNFIPPGTTADNPLTNNVSIVYNGSSPLGPTVDTTGTLTLWTYTPGLGTNPYSATGSKDSSGPDDEEVDSGFITVPVPEPTSLAGLGLAAIGLCARRSRRKDTTN